MTPDEMRRLHPGWFTASHGNNDKTEGEWKMNSFDKFAISLIGGTIALIVIGMLVAEKMRQNHEENMAKLGYEQVAMPGTDVPGWRKTDIKEK